MTMIAADAAERRTALLYLAILVFLWGGNYTWVKVAVRDIGPLHFNLLRYGGAVLAVVIVALCIGRFREIVPERGERMALAVVGLLQAALMTTATAAALVWLDASQVVLIAYSVPVWALLWAVPILREPLTLAAAAGAALGLAGLAVLTSPDLASLADGRLPGIAMAVVGVNGWALGAVLYRRRRWKSGFWRQVFWQMLVTAAAMAVLAPIFEDFSQIRWTVPMTAISVYNALAPTLLGFFFWSQALSRISAATAGQVMILAPVFGVIQSHLVLGEPLSDSIVAAALLITAGAWLSLRRTG